MVKKLGFERATTEITRAGGTITGYSKNKKKIYWRKSGYRGVTNLNTQRSTVTSQPTRASRLASLKAAQRRAGR